MVSLCPRCGAELPLELHAPGYARIAPQCRDCRLVVEDPPPMLAPGDDDDELEYELDEWAVADRGAVTAALVERELPYRWEPGLALVVRVTDEELVDSLLDDIEDAEWEADGDDDGDADEDDEQVEGGEEAQAAMSDLFVSADRLSHHPEDGAAAVELFNAADVVEASGPPYGIEAHVWDRVGALAGEVSRHLEESAGEDAVAASARSLRDFLRGYV